MDRQTISVALNSKAKSVQGVNLQSINDLVANAAGVDATRGDQVKVAMMDFDTSAADDAAHRAADAVALGRPAADATDEALRLDRRRGGAGGEGERGGDQEMFHGVRPIVFCLADRPAPTGAGRSRGQATDQPRFGGSGMRGDAPAW